MDLAERIKNRQLKWNRHRWKDFSLRRPPWVYNWPPPRKHYKYIGFQRILKAKVLVAVCKIVVFEWLVCWKFTLSLEGMVAIRFWGVAMCGRTCCLELYEQKAQVAEKLYKSLGSGAPLVKGDMGGSYGKRACVKGYVLQPPFSLGPWKRAGSTSAFWTSKLHFQNPWKASCLKRLKQNVDGCHFAARRAVKKRWLLVVIVVAGVKVVVTYVVKYIIMDAVVDDACADVCI